MKKLLSLLIALSFTSCANSENTEMEEAFIAVSIIESFVSQHANDDYVANGTREDCINSSEGYISYVSDDTEETINGYIITSCEFAPSDDLESLQSACNKNTNQGISGTVDLSTDYLITGFLTFTGLFEKAKTCTYRLEYTENILSSGTVCGYNVADIIEAGFSYTNPSSVVCSYLQ